MKNREFSVRRESGDGPAYAVGFRHSNGDFVVVAWCDTRNEANRVRAEYERGTPDRPTTEERHVSALANERAGLYGRTMEARFGLGFDAMFSDGALHSGHENPPTNEPQSRDPWAGLDRDSQ